MRKGIAISLTLGLCLSAGAGASVRSSTFSYTPEGLLASVDGPRNDVADVTTFTYDALGNPKTMRNALGHVTQYTQYDAVGRLLRMVDPNGLATSFSYHPRGWLLSKTIGDGAGAATTGFEYDPAGNLTRITLPDGRFIDLGYDAASRLTTVTDGLGNVLRYTLDGMGNHIREQTEDPQGSVTRVMYRVYEGLNRLQQEIGADPARTTNYAYDANGNTTDSTDALDRPQTAGYDALNRLIVMLDAAQGQTSFAYDARDNLTEVADPRGNITDYSYNAFDERISQRSPDTGTTTYTYDEAGNKRTVTDARGVRTDYHYDALNRLTAIDYPDADLDITFNYDQGIYGIGRLTQMADAAGTTDYVYDRHGNRVRETRTAGSLSLTTEYAFDPAGRLLTLTYPSGRRVHYGYDAQGRANTVTLERLDGRTQILAEGVSYLPFGPLNALDYGNGLALSRTFDEDYRLLDQQIPGIMDHTYAYDAVDNITAWQDRLDGIRNQLFEYDALDRLINAEGGYGDLAFSYDAVGNRLTAIDGGQTQTYLYPPDSNRLEEVSGGLADLPGYDANGNTTASARGDFQYDDRNRLAGYDAPGIVASYAYNGLGERVRKEVNGQVTHFRYANGQLIGEYDVAGNPIREYAYLDGQPQAMIVADPRGGGKPTDRIIDDPQSSLSGKWIASSSVPGYVGSGYLSHAAGIARTGRRIVDNRDVGFSTTGGAVWSSSTRVRGFVGADYQFPGPGDGMSSAGEIIDDGAAMVILTGQWRTSKAVGGFTGSGYHYHPPGNGTHAATWPLNRAEPGAYRLYARWTSHPNRTKKATYRVRHALGETVITVDQRRGGGSWYPLGTFPLDDESQLVLTGDADGYLIADAILLAKEEGTPNSATWRIGVQEPGAHRVFARWTSHPNRAPNAEYLVRHASGEARVTVDQRQGGGRWQLLGVFELNAGSHVALNNQAQGHIIADAIKIEPAEATPAPFQASWPLEAEPGDYEVFVRWTSHPNRASNVKYTIHHQNGKTSRAIDQRHGGGRWHSLGVFALDTASEVSIDSGGNGHVIADAVRIVSVAHETHGTDIDIFYTHTDHLGSVIKLTDDTRQLVWDAERLPFGEVRPLTELIEMPLRFPGQYYDEESGLHYNYFRDYDPSTGRYIQSDPIGLQGGLNGYAYTRGNPLRYIDPLGLHHGPNHGQMGHGPVGNGRGAATVGLGGAVQYGPGGAAISGTFGLDQDGRICFLTTTCWRVGTPSAFLGCGPAFTANDRNFKEGVSSSKGYYLEGGDILGGSVSYSPTSDGNGAAGGFGGLAIGAPSVGREWCETRTRCLN